MENTRALSSRRDMFLDERGTGLRVTWHPERDLVVLSVWQDDSCVGTFRMPVQDIPRLSGLLAAALGDWVDQTGPFPGTGGLGSGGGLRSGGGLGSGGGSGTGRSFGTGGPTAGGGLGAGGGTQAGGGWEGGGSRGREGEGRHAGAGGSQPGMGGGGYSLSVQQRFRLSRPVLKLRGFQGRRRRPD